MSVHYRFKSALEYDTITFDGLHISVKDLKNAILQQKRIGRSTDFDLLITNAQTQEVYKDENALIPKNTSLLIARIPLTVPKPKQWEGYGGNDTPPSTKIDDIGPIGKAVDLANLDAPEDDKIKAMMTQSTQEYDPSNYVKIRGANQVGPVPPSYRCYKCHQNGHWIKDCPLGQGVESLEIKKSTGIPQSFMVPVEGPQVPGAMMMSNGQYAVPALDYQAYSQKNSAPPPVVEPKPEIPDDLLCSICSDLLTDAVMIPCCGNSFCDECIRGVLLESEEHECPDCHEKGISPTTLIPNRFLRKSVANFKNTTGYEKKPVYKPKLQLDKEAEPKKEVTPPPVVDSTEKEHLKLEEKTVISEADSTEHTKNETDFSKDIDLDALKNEDVKGPPGVSPSPPSESPKHQITSKITNTNTDHRVKNDRDKKESKQKVRRSQSPRKHRHRRSPSYEKRHSEEKQDTPTRDEPPGIGNNYLPPTSTDSYSSGISAGALPGNVIGPLQGPPPSALPPGVYAPPGQQPPLGAYPPGPPPNFRIPPPGTQPPPFMGPGPYPLPPRPLYDPTRPPLGGPPSAFPPQYGGRTRDYNRGRGIRERTPPGVIDDPLAAFNRILREKDEKRARQQRLARRSWSRSRSRTRSFSRSPPNRRRSRTPRRRSRSRSFSMSRSRSRSYSKSPRGSSPAPPRRSPPPSLQSRRDHGRFRSPVRSPPHRRRTDRDRNDYERSSFRDKPRGRRGDSRDRYYEDRDRDYDRGSARAPVRGPPSAQSQWTGQREPYYQAQHESQGPQSYQNRYQPRDYIQNVPIHRKYEEIAPPGIDQPPVPGLETEPPPVADFARDRKTPDTKEKELDKFSASKDEEKDKREKPRRRDERRRSRSRVVSPDKWRNPSPKSKDGSPSRRRRLSVSDSKDDKRRDRDKDRNRDYSDDEKRRNKDKKKHKDKKEEKKRKKDKKDKHHKRVDKDKKEKKDEFKQVIPKIEGSDEDAEDKKKVDDKLKNKNDHKKHDDRKSREDDDRERELKKQAEEQKKEERRLRFIEDEKRKREEEARKEEAKRKIIDEARRKLEEEEELVKAETEEKDTDPIPSLYDKIIPEQDVHKEVTVEEFATKYNPMPEPKKDEVMPDDQQPFQDIGENLEPPDTGAHNKEMEEEDSSILELHSDTDIKLEDTDILAPVPEKSKWEVDEEGQVPTSPKEYKEYSDNKPAKVSNEVLKRAENVIFARAINSIRPIEIKKISSDRAVLYTDDKKDVGDDPRSADAAANEKPRLSVKDRLGVKVNDPDPRVILVENRRSKSTSPFSRRERRIEIQEHRRPDRHRSRSRRREYSHDKQDNKRRDRNERSSDKPKRSRRDDREKDDRKEKRRRSYTPSDSDERKRKRKEKKSKKDKTRKPDEPEVEIDQQKPKSSAEKRKPIVDEVNFEPDYDLELHDDEVASEIDKLAKKHKEARKSEADEESSSSDSSSSSTEEDRKKKKKKKHKKRKKRDSSTSSTESSGDSSDSDKERKRRKHKKTKKKKKKSKHK